MACDVKISPVTPSIDLSPASWLNCSFFTANKANSMQGTVVEFFKDQVKEYVLDRIFQTDSLPISGKY